MPTLVKSLTLAAGCLVGTLAVGSAPSLAAWEPTRTITFVVPAGTVTGVPSMVRVMSDIDHLWSTGVVEYWDVGSDASLHHSSTPSLQFI